MTPEQWAEEALLLLCCAHAPAERGPCWSCATKAATAAVRAAVAEEREACAEMADIARDGIRQDEHGKGWCDAASLIAEVIRKRGQP